MTRSAFFDFFLTSLKFYLDTLEVFYDEDLSRINFSKNGDHSFIIIEEYILESLVLLTNLLHEKEVLFSCGILYEQSVISGVEVCIRSSDLEKLDEDFSLNN